MSLTLRKVFEKAGVPSWKALVPGLNFVEICKLIGQSPWHAAWMLFPIVNIFTYAGMKVDLVRSFGKFNFMDSFWAVVFSPVIFQKIGSDNSKYEGQIVPKEKEYHERIREAQKNKDEKALKKLDSSPYKKGAVREWVEAIVFAVFAAAFIRMFLIEAYVIPTSSMEGSLLIGDYLFVSKAHYGIRTPMTVLQVPLLHNQVPVVNTESYLEKPSFGYHRLPALQSVQRGEPFVFNWPIGDSVIFLPKRSFALYQIPLQNKEITERNRKQIGNQEPLVGSEDYVVRPIDKKDHYIKRCVAVAGDILEVKDRIIYINGQPQAQPENVQYNYIINSGSTIINDQKLLEMGVNISPDEGGMFNRNPNLYQYAMTNAQVKELKDIGYTVELISDIRVQEKLFPHDTIHYKWAMDNYGPLKIPKAGESTELTLDNIVLYQRIIGVYESNKLEIKGNDIIINGSKATSYTFKDNYYWAMGDNRHNSEDSRFWGFVPETHVVGKPLFIWFSKGPLGIRWNRMFSSAIKK